jgi:hypothetical protein
METEQKQKRILSVVENIAKEPVTVEIIGGVVYMFGSELACLRIFSDYQCKGAVHNPNVRVGYSTNLKTWYVSIEKEGARR